ncbi:MAG: hypothetical protein A2255_00120 [Candidatus Melainabacteria bacterium RIFOXYA2_FULL_32_9]|nr:MAG: hypothetical protein A2255_00120 [Candidatus Melainabacteria bacterium RIFOXYA2_FULL_32_9]
MKNDDIWLVFGCSPFINKIKNKIPLLLKKYHSIGINCFPAYYPDCEYWLFNDAGVFTNLVKNNYNNQKLIVNKNLESELKALWINQHRYIIQDNFVIPPYYIFETVTDKPVFEKNGKLFGSYTSALHAINYAILENAKAVVLIGVDLSPSWDHFYDKRPVGKPKKELEVIKNHLNQFGSHIKIYKVNIKANLDVEYIRLNTLLSENFFEKFIAKMLHLWWKMIQKLKSFVNIYKFK